MEKSPAEVYKEVYVGETCDFEKSRQMQFILQYFSRRGYNIRRVLNQDNNLKTFYW